MNTALRLTIAAFGLATFNFSIATGHAEFNYKTNDGAIVITGYAGPGGDVVIPDTINDLPVVGIDWQAFSWRSDLISVAIPNSVNWIGGAAFYACSSLTGITIPESVDWIGDQAFGACRNLGAISVAPLYSSFSSLGGVLFNKSQTTLSQYPGGRAGSYTVPSTVTSIGIHAFLWCGSLTGVTIPRSVTSIGNGAFVGTSLTSVTIPDSVTNIGSGAFYQCGSLTTVIMASGITNVSDSTFSDCSNLTGVYFQGHCPAAGSGVFHGSDNATVYYLPGTLGWGSSFAGRPTALWRLSYPVILTTSPNFGVQTNGFGFIISWATNASVVVEASSTLSTPPWSPVGTNTLTEGWSYFSDPQWTNHPSRFYRVRGSSL